MNSHWPILLGLLLVGGAVTYGLMRQGESLAASKDSVPEFKSVPAKYNPNAPLPGTAPKSAPPAAKSPATPPVTVAPPTTSIVPAPQVQTPVQTQLQPAVVNGAPAPVDRDTLFGMLRAGLQQRFGAAPMVTNTGYAFVVEGARIDVDATANWSIVIFNNTKAQPPVQTENFLAIQNLVASTLDFDIVNTKTQQTADGKTVRRPISKLGKVSVETDPAMFNSTTIRPFGRTNFQPAVVNTGRTPVPVPGQMQQAPPQPIQPQTLPPAPPPRRTITPTQPAPKPKTQPAPAQDQF